jgi:hypothetical protein
MSKMNKFLKYIGGGLFFCMVVCSGVKSSCARQLSDSGFRRIRIFSPPGVVWHEIENRLNSQDLQIKLSGVKLIEDTLKDEALGVEFKEKLVSLLLDKLSKANGVAWARSIVPLAKIIEDYRIEINLREISLSRIREIITEISQAPFSYAAVLDQKLRTVLRSIASVISVSSRLSAQQKQVFADTGRMVLGGDRRLDDRELNIFQDALAVLEAPEQELLRYASLVIVNKSRPDYKLGNHFENAVNLYFDNLLDKPKFSIGTLYREIGHTIYNNLGEDKRMRFDKLHADSGTEANDFFDLAAANSAMEDFGYTFLYYLLDSVSALKVPSLKLRDKVLFVSELFNYTDDGRKGRYIYRVDNSGGIDIFGAELNQHEEPIIPDEIPWKSLRHTSLGAMDARQFIPPEVEKLRREYEKILRGYVSYVKKMYEAQKVDPSLSMPQIPGVTFGMKRLYHELYDIYAEVLPRKLTIDRKNQFRDRAEWIFEIDRIRKNIHNELKEILKILGRDSTQPAVEIWAIWGNLEELGGKEITIARDMGGNIHLIFAWYMGDPAFRRQAQQLVQAEKIISAMLKEPEFSSLKSYRFTKWSGGGWSGAHMSMEEIGVTIPADVADKEKLINAIIARLKKEKFI